MDFFHVSFVKKECETAISQAHQILILQQTFLYSMTRASLLYIFLSCLLQINSAKGGDKLPPFYSPAAEHWADSLLSKLSPDERISQLMMVSVWSNKDSVHIREIRKLITDWGIGGLIFFQGGPVREAMLTNDYQALSKVPLLIGIDGEWGLSMRLDSTVRFPRQMTLSAIANDSLIYKMGVMIANQCRRMGIHTNFSPDADVNNNPLNPVIGSRSFGDNPDKVYRNGLLYMNGLQDNHILATAKHFPGHGNADTDSHLSLPTIDQTRSELDSIELKPFRKLIDRGLGGVMVAHLNVPSLDSTANLPSTLSQPIVTGLLQGDMNFKGLIFTDAMNMKGVSSCYRPGILEKLAFMAGNDILLCLEDVHKAVEEIHYAVENCEIKQEEIDARAKKLLMVKYWAGLSHFQKIDTTNLIADLNSPEALALQHDLYEQAITTLSNKDSILPFHSRDSLRIASVVIGDKKDNAFQKQLNEYATIEEFAEEKDAPVSVFNALFSYLENFDYVILSMHGTTMKAQTNYGIPEAANVFIDSVLATYKTVFVDFGNAYTLSKFRNLDKAKAVVLAYEDFPLVHSLTAQAIMGGIPTKGKLPVNSTEQFKRDSGIPSANAMRLGYGIPEQVGLSSAKLNEIDTIVKKAILAGATPGCQVLVARNGKIVYNKAFGTKSYSDLDSVRTTDLYDIASVTKIAATSLAVMKLFDDKKIDLNQPLSKYYTRLKTTNKKALTIKEILAHQAGLQAWIPFYKQTMSDTSYLKGIYSNKADSKFAVRVADSLYMNTAYSDSLLTWIFNSPVKDRGKYVYSDLGPILMKLTTEKLTNKAYDVYLNENFYGPLGLKRFGYKPKERFPVNELVPTENDLVFRKQLVRGDVHDPAAAMMGGVSGNAGLFGDANDLAVIMQMLLNKGTYGGITYLKATTVDLFTKTQFVQNNNRRGLLFDKPEADPSKPSPCAKECSPLTFGHQGFTGTCVWVDPQYQLIYIFLSNRVNPDAANDKLVKMNVRTTIQSAIYKAMFSGTAY